MGRTSGFTAVAPETADERVPHSSAGGRVRRCSGGVDRGGRRMADRRGPTAVGPCRFRVHPHCCAERMAGARPHVPENRDGAPPSPVPPPGGHPVSPPAVYAGFVGDPRHTGPPPFTFQTKPKEGGGQSTVTAAAARRSSRSARRGERGLRRPKTCRWKCLLEERGAAIAGPALHACVGLWGGELLGRSAPRTITQQCVWSAGEPNARGPMRARAGVRVCAPPSLLRPQPRFTLWASAA